MNLRWFPTIAAVVLSLSVTGCDAASSLLDFGAAGGSGGEGSSASNETSPTSRPSSREELEENAGSLAEETRKLLREERRAIREDDDEKGYDGIVAEKRRSLSPYESFAVEGRRGECYWVTFALADGASFNSRARRILRFEFDHPTRPIDVRAGKPEIEEEEGTELTAEARSGRKRVGCPWQTAPLQIDLRSFPPGQQENLIRDLGQGDVVIQVLAKSISDEQVEKEKEEWGRAAERAEKRRREFRRNQCRECDSERCPGGGTNCKSYRICLERRGLSVGDCNNP